MFSRAFRRHLSLVFLATFCGLAVQAHAQEGDPLAAEAALLEQKAEQKVQDTDKDPDIKLLKKTDKARNEMEARLNTLQSTGQKFVDIEEGINGLSQKFLEATDKYYGAHSEALDAFQTAEGAGDKKAAKKAGKSVIKIRKTLLRRLKKMEKGFKKL
ncbi:MAG: hypothetical protein VX589_18575, partial [Myxococcota bacterium]|nr:hypothetical protein [Myxococcota bacterium]